LKDRAKPKEIETITSTDLL